MCKCTSRVNIIMSLYLDGILSITGIKLIGDKFTQHVKLEYLIIYLIGNAAVQQLLFLKLDIQQKITTSKQPIQQNIYRQIGYTSMVYTPMWTHVNRTQSNLTNENMSCVDI